MPGRHQRLIAQARKGPGEWNTVKVALVGKKTARSPFNLEGLLRSARSQIFVAGQNLYHLTRPSNAANYKDKIFRWLERKKQKRTFSVMVCRPERLLVACWKRVVGSDYERHLKRSLKVFKSWVNDARERRLSFKAYLTAFVPVTIAFVDPQTDAGYMVLTPIIYKPLSEERPHFVVGKKQHADVFDYYWHAYWDRLNDKAVALEKYVKKARRSLAKRRAERSVGKPEAFRTARRQSR